VLFTHCPEQQSPSPEHVAPSCAPEAPPHVLSHVPHELAPQQSLSVWHVPPESEHGFPQVPSLLHASSPQQSLSCWQESPVPRQPHVFWLLHTFGEQQSLLLLHDSPEPLQPQVDVAESQRSEPQQSPLPVHP
jgi:hypothetical protein